MIQASVQTGESDVQWELYWISVILHSVQSVGKDRHMTISEVHL